MEVTEKDFQKILVGVDQSEDAQIAFHYALKEAKKQHAALYIISIFEKQNLNVYQALDQNFINQKKAELQTEIETYRQQALDFGLTDVKVVIDEGDPGETIIKRIIPHTGADLLIVGSKSKKGITKYFGSQAAYMAKYAPISVMIIR